jgi:hypothetical protein
MKVRTASSLNRSCFAKCGLAKTDFEENTPPQKEVSDIPLIRVLAFHILPLND